MPTAADSGSNDLFPMHPRGGWPGLMTQVLVGLLAITVTLLVACCAGKLGNQHGGGGGHGLEPGDVAPDFTLPDAHGGTVTLSRLTPGKRVLIIFYLGYDCPHCVRHLRELANRKAEFDAAGVQILAISPDSIDISQQAIHDFGDFPFPVLSDGDKKVAAAYGVLLGDDVLFHGAFVIDGERKIRFGIRSDHPYDNSAGLLARFEALKGAP